MNAEKSHQYSIYLSEIGHIFVFPRILAQNVVLLHGRLYALAQNGGAIRG